MKEKNIVRFICVGGVLTAVTVLFQSAPVFLPAIGLALSPLSTLPVVIAAVSSISLGFSVFFASAFILAFVSTQETIIFLLTTGILGIAIGALLFRKGIAISICVSSVTLSLGIAFLTYIAGVPSFVEFMGSLSIPFASLIFFSFSLVYASAWNMGLRKLENYLIKFIR